MQTYEGGKLTILPALTSDAETVKEKKKELRLMQAAQDRGNASLEGTGLCALKRV